MKRRLRSLQTLMRVANGRIEMARAAHAEACRQHEEVQARCEAADRRRRLVVQEWQWRTREIAQEHARLEGLRAELGTRAAVVTQTREALIARSRDHAMAENLSERTAAQIARDATRRDQLAHDEQWLLLEERRR